MIPWFNIVRYWKNASQSAESEIVKLRQQVTSLTDTSENLRILRRETISRMHHALLDALNKDELEKVNTVFMARGLGRIK
jgi:proline dehydrogenase